MSGRSATTSIARMTAILGAFFVVNCLALSVVYQIENKERLIIDDETVATQPVSAPATSSTATSDDSTAVSEETSTEDLTPTTDSSEGSVPLAEETSDEDAGPKEDE